MSVQFYKICDLGLENNLLIRRKSCKSKKYQFPILNHDNKWFAPKYEYQVHARRGANKFISCVSYSYTLKELKETLNWLITPTHNKKTGKLRKPITIHNLYR